MPEPRYTDAQARVIHHDAGHAVVSAVAGSGKIQTLIGRVRPLLRTTSPQRIAEVLEDFTPFAQQPAIQTFQFQLLLRELNGPEAHLETCDCALHAPTTHDDPNSTRVLAIHGRLFQMFRDQRINCSAPHAEWLCGKLPQRLQDIDQAFTANDGVVDFTRNPVLHTEMSRGSWRPDGQFECDDGDRLWLAHDARLLGLLRRSGSGVHPSRASIPEPALGLRRHQRRHSRRFCPVHDQR